MPSGKFTVAPDCRALPALRAALPGRLSRFARLCRCPGLGPLLTLSIGFFFFAPSPLVGNDALFIGNSFTNGNTAPVRPLGGVPRMVELIAESKGKALTAAMSAPDGVGWENHLKNQTTRDLGNRGNWNAVVIQNLSTKPTRIGNPRHHCEDGVALSGLIRKDSPEAKIVLYETWPRHPDHPLYREKTVEQSLSTPEEMMADVKRGYERLAEDIRADDLRAAVVIARVGEAFERCRIKHPEIVLYCEDLYHANETGSYLAALVLYAAIFNDSPVGAATDFFSFSIPPDIARKLQAIAEEVQSQPDGNGVN